MTKSIMITEEQLKFLEENKGALFEYYVQASDPRGDSRILGNLQVWVYGDDRQNFTPHCHVMTNDRSVEFEVSLLDWTIINVKSGDPTAKMLSTFSDWLNNKSTRLNGVTNKMYLLSLWDGTNNNNTLSNFVEKHNINVNDKDILTYLESFKKDDGLQMV